MKNAKKRKGSDPRCWWCHESIPLDNPFRGRSPESDYPIEVGFHICGFDCPQKPEEGFVYTHDVFLRG